MTATSWTHNWLTSGHVYEYGVASVFHGTESYRSTVSAIEVEPPPDIPQNVKALAGNAVVTISWSAVVGASSYSVYGRDASAGQAFQPVQWNVNSTSWTHQLLINGHRYEYAVSAVNGGSESVRSVVVGTTPNAPLPANPTDVSASASGTSISLSWSPVTGADSYAVYARDRTIGESAHVVQWGLSSPNWTQYYLTPGHVYEYFVTASAGAESNPSTVVRIMAGGPRPGAPGALNATASNHAVSLSWSAVPNAESYTVYGRDETSGEAWRAVQWNLTSLSWTHMMLTNGHRYAYYVVAVRGYLEGGRSPVISAVPFRPAPPAPTNVRVSGGVNAITISWDAVSGADSYTVYRSELGSGFTPVQWDITGTSWTQNWVQPYRENTYYVTAIAGGVASAPSWRVSAMAVGSKPYPCNNLTPTDPWFVGNDSNGLLSFQWTHKINGGSGAWGFHLSPALVALGGAGAEPAIGNAYYMVNGALDSNFYNKAGPGVTVGYYFHSQYHGLYDSGLFVGDELQLTITVSFNFVAPNGGRGRANVKAHDCYQLLI